MLIEMLASGDFGPRAKSLGAAFRETRGLPEVAQLGLAVHDVEASAARLEARGVGPFFIASGAPEFWVERGEDRAFSGKLGMARHGGVELELLEPGQGSDFYARSLGEEGDIVVQHLGMLVGDVDAWSKRLEARGYPVYVRGRLSSGPMVTDFAYMDTEAEAGFVMEFISWRLFGRSFDPPGRAYRALGHIQRLLGPRSFPM